MACAFLQCPIRFAPGLFACLLLVVLMNPAEAETPTRPSTRPLELAFFVATAALVVAGYIGVSSLSAGDDFNLNSVAGAVIGGTALAGGSGSIAGGAAGAFLLGLIASPMRFLGLP